MPVAVDSAWFNPDAVIPFDCTVEHIRQAMESFTEFLGFINVQLFSKRMVRLESFLMPANFSSIVGEFMSASIPKFSPGLAKNNFHNGHPDLVPAGRHPRNAIQYSHEGIEIKASRYFKGWQGHNPEDSWLMVFVFSGNGPYDVSKGIEPVPFRFEAVYGAQLVKDDWQFAGRSSTSRRTITAAVKASGYEKMTRNWIYRDASER